MYEYTTIKIPIKRTNSLLLDDHQNDYPLNEDDWLRLDFDNAQKTKQLLVPVIDDSLHKSYELTCRYKPNSKYAGLRVENVDVEKSSEGWLWVLTLRKKK